MGSQTRPRPRPALAMTVLCFLRYSSFLASGTPHSGARPSVALAERKLGLQDLPHANTTCKHLRTTPGTAQDRDTGTGHT